MRIVLDSSVLLAAYISRAGVCAALLEDVLMSHELFISEFIRDEVARKLREKFRFTAESIHSIERFLMKAATCIEPTDLPLDACRDPADIPILGTAVASQADFLITVDKDLLALAKFGDIAIIKPGEFWNRGTAFRL